MSETTGETTRQFQIDESDLAELERIIPDLHERLWGKWDTKTRKQCEKAKAILSNVRWRYGPPLEVKEIQAGE